MTPKTFPKPVVKRNKAGEPRALLAYVRVNGKQMSKEFPLGTKRSIITKWQEDEADRGERVKEHGIVSGTFAADVERYLKLQVIQDLTSFKARRSDTNAWVPELAEMSRNKIKAAHVEKVMAKWNAAGVAAQTRRHRLNALRDLWVKLDKGTEPAWAPDVKAPQKPRAIPQALDYDRICTTLNQMEPSATKGFLLILAYCGFRPSEIKRTEPWMVTMDGDAPQVIRNTAKGGREQAMPLTAPALLGWKMFAEHNGWKRSLPNVNRDWKHAMERAGFEPVKCYALVHSFCTRLYLSSGDLQLVQKVRGHADIKTTQRYANVTVDPRAKSAMQTAFATAH